MVLTTTTIDTTKRDRGSVSEVRCVATAAAATAMIMINVVIASPNAVGDDDD